LILLIKNNPDISVKAVWMSFGGFLYISLSIGLFLNLRDISYNANDDTVGIGKVITCGIIFSIWINDTMAYIVGSLFGKTPFSKISPKKTWEGTGGGAVLCVAVIGLLGYFIPAAKQIAVQHWIAIAAICAIFGTAGDLLESKIKRMADVKDSGTIMPGHGGFLDRFDSLLVATPFVWLYIKLFV
jgi:phosphatidate cytidylyltransferase